MHNDFCKGNWFLFKLMAIKCFMLRQIYIIEDEAMCLLLLRKQCTVHSCSGLHSTEVRHMGIWHTKLPNSLIRI